MSAFGEQVQLMARQEEIQVALESVGDDMTEMTKLLDELDSINNKVLQGSKHCHVSAVETRRDLSDPPSSNE